MVLCVKDMLYFYFNKRMKSCSKDIIFLDFIKFPSSKHAFQIFIHNHVFNNDFYIQSIYFQTFY